MKLENLVPRRLRKSGRSCSRPLLRIESAPLNVGRKAMMMNLLTKVFVILAGLTLASRLALYGQSEEPPPRPLHYTGSSFSIDYEKQFPLGKPWPIDLRHAKIEIDSSLVPSWDSYFKDWTPTVEEVKETLSSYYVISRQEWTHSRSHVAGNDRGGWLTLEDGTKLKWMLRPGGLGLVLYPDGGAVYLDACCPEKQ